MDTPIMKPARPNKPPFALLILSVVSLTISIGCNSDSQSKTTKTEKTTSETTTAGTENRLANSETPVQFEPETYEASADQLLAARLPADESRAGWVRLFDGHTLFGWEITGEANFRVQDNSIFVDEGAQCLMCTSSTWGNFELELEFNADEKTNSGVFVRTPFDPENPAIDCYEINIAPTDNPFPTGSIVSRKKATEQAPEQSTEQAIKNAKPGTWRTMNIIADGKDISVSLDGETVCEYSDDVELSPRRIGLQHNSGRVQFRNLKIRPLDLDPMLDEKLSQWKKYPEMPGDFSVNDDGELHVVGGSAQLETNESYGNFTLLAEYKIDDPAMNSGIFFRCIPGDKMMGYECQVNNGFKGDSRLTPLDCGTGGIFRRQDARVIAGENGKWSTVLLQANENKICAWVEGVQVSDWEDTRETHENPRKGKRLEPGTIMIQGHDPKTDLLFRNLQIGTL